MNLILKTTLSLALLFCLQTVYGQNSDWKKLSNSKQKTLNKNLKTDVFYQLDYTAFNSKLVTQNASILKKEHFISIPDKTGTLHTFKIFEQSNFTSSLAKKYPAIKSYIGYETNNSGTKLILSTSHKGIQTWIQYPNKADEFLMPVNKNPELYRLYSRHKTNDLNKAFICRTKNLGHENINNTKRIQNQQQDQVLRTFNMAISVNGEYTQYHGGSVADALAAINATLSRVNAIFETDMAIRFKLIDATELIYTNPETDPYSDVTENPNNINKWNLELQNTLTNTIGNNAYNIGHMFGASGGGGDAGCIGCVCRNDTTATTDLNKGSGISSPIDNIPEGDTFDLDYVAHEIGHQMGATHTFAFTTEGTNTNAEPGSGSTIMAYAGITNENDIQLHSDPYFHYHSINQILNVVKSSQANCATTSLITNKSPIAQAGNNYHIPPGTAYVLKGNASNIDTNENLTYCWEQLDSGEVSNLNFNSELPVGSLNRSLPPTTENNRYIPKWDRILQGKLTEQNPTLNSDWETVATASRTLNWGLTVRDRAPENNNLPGQSSQDSMTITVEDAEPFTVETPNTWASGTPQKTTWQVGKTNDKIINCQTVNIKLSTDGGQTFPVILASNTENDGEELINLPELPDTEHARLLIEAADNIFFTLSENFSIVNSATFIISSQDSTHNSCGNDSVSYTINYQTFNGFSETTALSVENIPQGAIANLSKTTLTNNDDTVLTISGLNNLPPQNHTLKVNANSNSKTDSIDLNINVIESLCLSAGNTNYDTSITQVNFNTINNSSGKSGGYENYSEFSTHLFRGIAYELRVNVNTAGDYNCVTTAWIDWNQNCTFDNNEIYDLGVTNNSENGQTSNTPLTIEVPNDAVEGFTKLRITTKYNQHPNACETNFDGEVEDYPINVIIPTDDDHLILAYYPNPTSSKLNLILNSTKPTVFISVFDMKGRRVFYKEMEHTNDYFEIQNELQIKSGLYVLQVSDGARSELKKIIIK